MRATGRRRRARPQRPRILRCLSLLLALSSSPGLLGGGEAIDPGGPADDDAANGDGAIDVDGADPQTPDVDVAGAGRSGGGPGPSSSSRPAAPSIPADPSLGDDSVVLITGAAGFLGAELALALRRTYGVRRLLLVDHLGVASANERLYVSPPGSQGGGGDDGKSGAMYERASERELGAFEVRRQRAFRVFHELTSARLDEGGGSEEGGEGGRRDYNDAESVRFYRADMRPSIPEFFDFGEVPLLEGIFQSHPDITHVVHLADVPVQDQNQAIPRNKDSIKTGPMEGLLEEMRLMLERAAASPDDNEGARLPQFVYASSHEVYDAIAAAGAKAPKRPNPPPFREDGPITTPSSLHGTAKLIDEVLASAYHSTHGIYSVGLRFFDVYGPWNSPGTAVFDLAERVTTMNDGQVGSEDWAFDDDVRDFVFIDDAVDAIMAAMQYRPPGSDPPPVVFNVGTGVGSTLQDLREEAARHFPGLGQAQRPAKADADPRRLPARSYASTVLAESHLGFKARVSLREGLARTLAWHRDRKFPYGRDPNVEEPAGRRSADAAASASLSRAMTRPDGGGGGDEDGGCSPLDRECLRSAPVFPCASECRREERCTPSAWDDLAVLSRAVTAGCDAVLYTILLDGKAEQIPSAVATAGEGSLPYVGAGLPEDGGKRTQARCNVAFVSDGSPLVQRLRSEEEEYLDEEDGGDGGLPPLLRHGFWTVLPVSTQSSDANAELSTLWLHTFDSAFALEHLPKVSPGRFFGSSVRYAVYAAPSVLLYNLPGLLRRMEATTFHGQSRSAAVMIPARRPSCDPAQRGSPCASTWTRPEKNDALQSSAYNMIRVALSGDMLGGGLDPVVESSVLVHLLRTEDARLFRCDVYGEAAQWGASSDERAFEFIVSLHDLWSRAVRYWSGRAIWWNEDDDVQTPEGDGEGDGGEEEIVESEGRSLGETNAAVEKEQQGKWMGVLSSTDMQMFTHILPSDDMGIIHLDDHH